MGLFDWFRRPQRIQLPVSDPDTLIDPVFGPDVPDDEGIWFSLGMVVYREELPSVEVSVPVVDAGPSEPARVVFRELRRLYPERL